MFSRVRIIGILGTLSLSLAGCGGGGGTGGATLLPSGGSTGTPAITFGTASAAPMSLSESRVFQPQETGYSGTFNASSSDPSVMTISPASGPGPFTAHAVKYGATTVSISDANGHGVVVSMDVSQLSLGTFSTAPLAPSATRTLAPSEPGFSGSFSATSSDPKVLSISPASGPGPFTVTGVAAGSATITVSGSAGHSAAATIVVSGSAPAPTTTPSSQPTLAPIGVPTATPTLRPTVPPTVPPTATPAPTPTAFPIVSNPASVEIGAYAKQDLTLSGMGIGATMVSAKADASIATVVRTGPQAYSIVTGGTAGSTSVTFSDGTHVGTVAITNTGAAPAIDPGVVGFSGAISVGIGSDALTVVPSSLNRSCPQSYNVDAGVSDGIVSHVDFQPSVTQQSKWCASASPYYVSTGASGNTYITINDGFSTTTYVGFGVGP